MEKKLLPVPSLVLFTCLNLIPSSRVPRSVQPHKRQVRQYKCHETEVIVTPGGSERILGWGDKLRALVLNARLFTQHKQLRDPRTNDATKTWSLIRPWSPPSSPPSPPPKHTSQQRPAGAARCLLVLPGLRQLSLHHAPFSPRGQMSIVLYCQDGVLQRASLCFGHVDAGLTRGS